MPTNPSLTPREHGLYAKVAELEKVKDSHATMALQNASLLTDLDQVILDRNAAEARVKELEAKLAEVSKPCEWAEDEDEGLWTATCGLVDWCFNEGDPIENRVHFCVGCGHPVVVKDGEARNKGAEHGE